MSVYLNEQFGQPRAEDVKFSAKWRGCNNECCEFCGGITSVVIIKYPVSKRRGKRLEFGTKYHETWICGECFEKLKIAVNGLEKEDDE